MPLIPGIVIAMGGKDWIVPPLTLGQLRRLMPKIRTITNVGVDMGEDQIGVLIELVTEALTRNYPGLAPDLVESLLDLGNAQSVMQAILTGSGLKPSSGEATAVSNGALSMDSSPPPADTATL
jgi:hypothetical protein